jgi:hypothetical protein
MSRKSNLHLFSGLLGFGTLFLVTASLALAYPWPLAPQDVQHNVSATFGECREDRDHFHDGTDIPLGQGGAVLAVADGTVLTIDPAGSSSYIRVGRYCYLHVNPNPDLNEGDFVHRGDLVGTTNDQNHIHFKDGGGASGTTTINALRPGGLAPFEDPYKPTVQTIRFYPNSSTSPFPTAKISGLVDVVSRSFDKTDNSTYGGNNGVYSIGWEVFAADETTSVYGPFFPYTFDTIPSNSYIENVYFQGSNTSTYYYIVTNQITHDSFWDTRWVDPGPYKVAVYCCDTRDNWDTTGVWVEVVEQDVSPPAMPTLASVIGTRENSLAVTWQPDQDDDLKGYRLYHGYDGENWFNNYDENDLPDSATILRADYFQNGRALYFRLTAVDSAAVPNESGASDIYGTRLTDTGPKVLVVDGFDRTSGIWTEPSHPFTLSHARALDALEIAFDCCSNEAVAGGDVSLDEYDAVVWVLGDESDADTTFSPGEQALITTYLEAGGNLFLSGSEVGYDLVEQGTAADSQFYHEILRAELVAGDAGADTVSGIAGTIFAGLSFAFADSSQGLYGEEGPDAIDPRNGGQANLTYAGTPYHAGLEYAGPFGPGTAPGRLVYLGFPFETIVSESTRTEVMSRVVGFFEIATEVAPNADQNVSLPGRFALFQNYPNPFNPSTTITFSLPGEGPRRTTLKIFNVLGQTVRTLLDASLVSGEHAIVWDGRDDDGQPVGSGIYLYTLKVGRLGHSRKMILLR